MTIATHNKKTGFILAALIALISAAQPMLNQ